MSEHGSPSSSTVEHDVARGSALRSPPHLDLLLDADPSALAFLRHRSVRWLRELRWPETPIIDAVTALNAAVSNSVQHAYSDPGGCISVHGLAAGRDSCSAVRFTVRDQGRWKVADPSRTCFGLALMGVLSEELFIETGRAGTVVVLTTPVVPIS